MKTYYIKIKLSSSLNIEDTYKKIEEAVLIGTEMIEVPSTLEVERIDLYKSGPLNLWGLL